MAKKLGRKPVPQELRRKKIMVVVSPELTARTRAARAAKGSKPTTKAIEAAIGAAIVTVEMLPDKEKQSDV